MTRLSAVLYWVGLPVRLGLAAVWLTSGIAKALDPAQTVVAVRAYRLLGESLVRPVAAILPWLEIALGVLLVLGLATRLAAALSALVLLAFIVGVISAAARGLLIDCGCFGGGGTVAPGETQYTVEILRDIGFLLLAGWLIWRPVTPLSVDALVAARSAGGQDGDADQA